MCDEESCESLKSAMEAVGQKTQNIYNDMSKVEDILSQLELRLKRLSTTFELFKITGNKGTYIS